MRRTIKIGWRNVDGLGGELRGKFEFATDYRCRVGRGFLLRNAIGIE